MSQSQTSWFTTKTKAIDQRQGGTLDHIEQDTRNAFAQGIDFATLANPLNTNRNPKAKAQASAFERQDLATLDGDPFLSHTPPAASAGTQRALDTAIKAGRNQDVDLANDVFMAGHFNVPMGMQRLLQVTIVGARGLRDREGTLNRGPSKPYVVCEIVNKRRSRFKTSVVTNKKEVEWNVTQSLPEYVDGDFLKFTVVDKGMLSSTEIGEAVLSPDQFMKNGYQGWLSLDDPHKEGKDYKFPYLNVSINFQDAAIDLGADPFMASLQGLPEDRRGWCGTYCSGCKDCLYSCGWQMRQCLSRMKYASVVCCMQCNVWCIGCGIFLQKLWGVCMGKNTLHSLRAYMVRNCGMDSKNHLDIADQDVACCCIPLRTMIFFLAANNFTIACMLLFARTSVPEGDRVLSGGYSLQSKVLNDMVETSGIFFAPFGLVGAVALDKNHLETYNHWQFFRLATWCLSYFMDEPLLWHCELWRSDVQKATEMYGWNPTMYEIAINQRCTEEFLIFICLSIFSVLINMYNVSLVRRLIADVNDEPRYLLHMPMDTPSGAFFSYSYSQGKSYAPYAALGKKAMPPPASHVASPASHGSASSHAPFGQAPGYGAVPPMVGHPVGISQGPPGAGPSKPSPHHGGFGSSAFQY